MREYAYMDPDDLLLERKLECANDRVERREERIAELERVLRVFADVKNWDEDPTGEIRWIGDDRVPQKIAQSVLPEAAGGEG